MDIKYPNGKKFERKELPKQAPVNKPKIETYGNRGMTLEEYLNDTNQFYRERKIAVIHKKPTPVQIVQVDYPKRSAAVIKEAYFKLASTTDYNGVYNGKYIDFEAKETKSPTSFPLKNFHQHQISHMKEVMAQGGICFVILMFTKYDEVFFLEAKHLLAFWERMMNGGRKSITKQEIEQNGHLISLGFQPRIDYIKILDALNLC
ncbi:Holliday junction resolvase RecU [Neobacillus mesonae]|uniref:Holliday junction resolvase RecU n=1 Tax=Neobacillus mesonae TaxID=1193713 RepID=A0A3T0I194_9BACI|nr:Holliday junction resolvase RecU [Neobacillus mesonae]AZU63116.1 Holliday junction resolvase RecU [Neobacillus mesonae]MED4204179.1 Holliday junction resolvase RecU [Neobacillus mesonae]